MHVKTERQKEITFRTRFSMKQIMEQRIEQRMEQMQGVFVFLLICRFFL